MRGHTQGIGIILFHFPNCFIIYPVVPVYYCPGHPSNRHFFLCLPSTMIQHLYSQLLQLSEQDIRAFDNYVEVLDTSLMAESSMAINSSHQVLE